MHPNKSFTRTDEAELLAFIGEAVLARIFAQTPDGPRVAHVPVLVRHQAEGPVLHFHLANGNALAKSIDGLVALAVCEGANGYISANWYQDVRGSVPTWNYVAVECEGTVRVLKRPALITLLDDLTAMMEPRVGENWSRAKMEANRFEAMLGAITAYELEITALRGTRKLSQNKAEDDVAGVLAGMDTNGMSAIAGAMRELRR